MMRFILTFVFAAAMLVQAAFAQLETSPLSVKAGEETHDFTVEMATTPEQIQQGLMFRQELAPDAGMLFDFGVTRQASMWMKNTLIPLDMLFIAADGTIESIRERTVPHSEEPVRSIGKVRAVLELNSGSASRLRIKPGDRVRHAIFGN